MTLQERIDRLAEWMGWALGPFEHWYDKAGSVRAEEGWNPFESHDDAFMLLKECERRMILEQVAREFVKQQGYVEYFSHLTSIRWAWLASPTQITEAVKAVALPKEKP